MKRFQTGALAATVVCGLGAAGSISLATALPATWLQWEGAAAQSQAQLVAGAASARAQAELGFLFTGFDRATASLHSDQLTGDTVALTAKLLRIEPLVAPVTGLAVVNQAGMQVAASSVAIDPAAKPVWWTSAMADLPTRDTGLLGCGGARPYVAGFVLARRIAGEGGTEAGAVAGLLAAPDLLNMVQPAGGPVAFSLRDSAGCVLLHGNEAQVTQDTGEGGAWLSTYRRMLLPAGWGQPAPVVATAKVGNLVWSGTISPGAALALRQGDIGRHATVIERVSSALAVLGMLLLAVPLWLAKASRRAPAALPAEKLEPVAVAQPVPTHPAALVVGFTAAERQRVAARLERAGLEAETAEDGFLALDPAGRAAYMHGALDLMVLDGACSSFRVHELLGRLKRRGDLDRLRIVLMANGCFAGAFGGPAEAAGRLDALVTDIFAVRPGVEVREGLLVAGE
jgi:hypothetical protein